MSRPNLLIAWLTVTPVAVAAAQLSGGIGPVAEGTSTGAANWKASGQLSSAVRFDSPAGFLAMDGSLHRRDGATRLGPLKIGQVIASPAAGGLRIVGSADYTRDPSMTSGIETIAGRLSLTFRRSTSGAWLGTAVERHAAPAMVTGLWRQIGARAVVSVASTVRRGYIGGTPPHFWTETHWDSIYTDTAGWHSYPVERLFGDSGSAPSRLMWAETEARVGWTRGRVALDGVVGWRPTIDTSKQSAWARGYATVAVSRGVALSLGAGTTTRQLPFARSTGHFGLIALRFAPAELVRPRGTPEISTTPTAFVVERTGAEEYIVRVRMPRARVVELSGDFNQWKPVRLSRGGDNEWVVSLVLKPGTYRMNLRVDGEAWVAPPGTTVVDDEFNGRVGIVVVR